MIIVSDMSQYFSFAKLDSTQFYKITTRHIEFGHEIEKLIMRYFFYLDDSVFDQSSLYTMKPHFFRGEK